MWCVIILLSSVILLFNTISLENRNKIKLWGLIWKLEEFSGISGNICRNICYCCRKYMLFVIEIHVICCRKYMLFVIEIHVICCRKYMLFVVEIYVICYRNTYYLL